MMPMQILRNQAGRVLRNGDNVILRGIAIMYVTFAGTLETGSLVFDAGTYPATAHVEDGEVKYWEYKVTGGGETRQIQVFPRVGASSEWEVSIILQGGVSEDIRSFWRREQGVAGTAISAGGVYTYLETLGTGTDNITAVSVSGTE